MANTPALAKYTDFKSYFEKNKSAVEQALPKHLSADRILRVALTELRNNPKLLECERGSVFASIVNSSMLGLEIGNGLGHAYMVPFYNSKEKRKDAQLVIGYRGMIDLARRSGQVISINAQPVYSNDEFEFEYGLNPKLRHVPNFESQGEFIGAYAVAILAHEGNQFVFVPKRKINEIKKATLDKIPSDYGKSMSPWSTSFDEMAKKTAVRALFKYLPVSIELAQAVALDEKAERGESTNFIFDNDETINESSLAPEPDKLDELANQLNDNIEAA